MEPEVYMDLVGHMAQVPPLLEACVSKDIAALRSVRLVNKEASHVALLGLRTYTLTLKGDVQDTNVIGTSLLQRTTLEVLQVHLRLSDAFSPAILLAKFINSMHTPLASVTTLFLVVEEPGGTAEQSHALWEGVSALASKCPALRILGSTHSLSRLFQYTKDKAFPLLQPLQTCVGGKQAPDSLPLTILQPSPFLHLRQLIMQGAFDELPDLSMLASTTQLVVEDCSFDTDAHWLLLPPNLKSLWCWTIDTGPQALMDGQPSLSKLSWVTLKYAAGAPLHSLAQLMRAAPELFSVEVEKPGLVDFVIHCPLDTSTAADLLRLDTWMDEESCSELYYNAVYQIDCSKAAGGDSLQDLIASLPCSTNMSHIELDSCRPVDIAPLLSRFPDVVQLRLSYLDTFSAFTDVGLRELRVCNDLTKLRLTCCDNLTPMGLLTLCLRLRGLRSITCSECDLLKQPALDGCVQLLEGYGCVVELLDEVN